MVSMNQDLSELTNNSSVYVGYYTDKIMHYHMQVFGA